MKLEWAEGEQVDITYTPVRDAAAPVLVVWPAFGTPARFYRHLTPALTRAGFTSIVVEYPGLERADGVGRHTTYGYDALATAVHEAVMGFARVEHPEAPVVLLGHSLGGHVTTFAAALHVGTPAAPDGVVLVASASPYWRGYTGAGRMRALVGTALMAGVSRGVGYWPGDRFNFWGRQSRVLVADWARLARTGRVEPHGARADYAAALAAYDGDVLAVSLPDDGLAPVSALERLLALMPKAHVTRWHSPERRGHIQWVRHHETIVPVIASWVAEHVPAAR